MNKKIFIKLFLIFSILGLTFFKNLLITYSEDLPIPEKLLKDINTAYKDINSYGYTIYQEGWDIFTKEKEKEGVKKYREESEKKYSPAKEKYEKDMQLTEETEKPVYKKSKFEYKFMKSYLIQMRIIDSDYVPDFMNGSMLTYRPDEDSEVVWFKIKYSPFAIKRNVKGEFGCLFTANWNVSLMILDYYSKNGKMKVEGIEKFKGNEAYKLTFKFNIKNESDVKEYEIDYKKWGIPIEVKYKVDTTLEVLPRQKSSSMTYWIDKKRKIILGREEYISGKLHWREWYEDIKLNQLSEKDF